MPHARLARSARFIRLTWTSALLLAGIAPAWAQFGGSLSLQTDPRFRGVPLNGGKPQGQVSLSYDEPTSGWYGGALLSRMRFAETRRSSLGQAYVGRVLPLSTGLDAEAGVSWTHYTSLPSYDYAEAYAGLLSERWNARLYYSGNYYGRGQPSVYAEWGLNWPLSAAIQGFVHLGALKGSSGLRANPHGSTRFDARLGAALRQGSIEYQLAWSTVSRGGPYAGPYEAQRQSLMLGAALSF